MRTPISFVRVAVVLMLASWLRSKSKYLDLFVPSTVAAGRDDDESIQNVVSAALAKWLDLPSQIRQNFTLLNLDALKSGFDSINVAQEIHRGALWIHESELIRACSHALGNDIVFERVGSLLRGTAAGDWDMDFQVRRSPSSKQWGEPFTETDKQKVAQNLAKLSIISGPVTIGNVAIKFQMKDSARTHVDLVLVSKRPEEFPKLRGGKDFYENCDRINCFLEHTPVARDAIVGVKACFPHRRPKGILLDAVAWRLAKTFPFPLTTLTDKHQSVPATARLNDELFGFFIYFVTMLEFWEESPFASDLKEDFDMLPDSRKREEHIQSFDIGNGAVDWSLFGLLSCHVEAEARKTWIESDGPFALHLKRKLWEFFRLDQ